MKIQIYQLVDQAEDESALAVVLQQAKDVLANQPERDILDDLTPVQFAVLERALEQHRIGKTISHDVMKTRINQWLNR